VVINRDGAGNNEVRDICSRRGVDILATFPDQRRIAELCARGELFVNHLPEYKERFVQLFDRIAARVSQ
jgi:MinD superfamily P-loop ATPase